MDKPFVLMTTFIGIFYLMIVKSSPDALYLVSSMGIVLGMLILGGAYAVTRWSDMQHGYHRTVAAGFIIGSLSSVMNPFILDQFHYVPAATLVMLYSLCVAGSFSNADPSRGNFTARDYLSALFPYAGAFSGVLMVSYGVPFGLCLILELAMGAIALLLRRGYRPSPENLSSRFGH